MAFSMTSGGEVGDCWGELYLCQKTIQPGLLQEPLETNGSQDWFYAS